MKLTEIARFTDEPAAMIEFYRKLLGADPAVQSADMAIFKCGDTTILIHKTYTPGPGDLACEDHIAFNVPDLDEACTTLLQQGIAIETPPVDYPWGRSAYLRDPDGQLIELSANMQKSA